MSKGTLSSFKSEISREKRIAAEVESDMKDLENSIFKYINDEVGYSASESIKRIARNFSYNLEEGYKGAENMASALGNAYSNIDNLLQNAESLVSRARGIKRELGNL